MAIGCVCRSRLGILSTHLPYLSHRNRWGRLPYTLVPSYNYNTPGFGQFINLDELYTHSTLL
ncbi:hypothetical protein [Pontibacter ruber]|uniref:Uncharacterized protein n=1 Tax=Pontibacter ruber TaxID=1343895 RepID=A0ABW5D2U6_9BACT|nr:hypothetical protein [Pontibacter ruber]